MGDGLAKTAALQGLREIEARQRFFQKCGERRNIAFAICKDFFPLASHGPPRAHRSCSRFFSALSIVGISVGASNFVVSLPHAIQPSRLCRANISRYGPANG